MAEFILELYSEEIPAGMQSRAMDDLARLVTAVLKENNIAPATVKTYAAPQRLALMLDGLPVATEARKIEKKGPKIDAPKQALDGFLRANGLSDVSALKVQSHPKGDFYILESDEKGQSVAGLLADALPRVIENFPWPKSMRWGSGKLRWVRPLRAILCRFDGAVVPFEVGGLVAGGVTYGHRFMAATKSNISNKADAIEITSIADYLPKLKAAFVMADPVERRAKIVKQATELAAKDGLELVEDDALLTEIAGLVEWPVCLMGKIDDKFMQVPDEVLTSVMRTHQKYLTLRDPKAKKLAPRFITVANIETGKLAPHFVAVSNMETKDEGAAIITGNERVLRARLSDAKFFWDKDRETSLEKNLPALDNIIFHAELGSVGDKVERLEKLAGESFWGFKFNKKVAKKAARLCKADLVSGMVYEFPELQGIMGGYYANDKDVGVAIRDHYKPLGVGDDMPSTPEGCVLALADKLDTLAGFWLIDEKPTSSKDPYALRRAALGVIRILDKTGSRFGFSGLVNNVVTIFADKEFSGLDAEGEASAESLTVFIMERLKIYLRDRENIRHDIVAAAIESNKQKHISHIIDSAKEVNEFLNTDDGIHLLAVYKRAYGICKQADMLPEMGETIAGVSFGGLGEEAADKDFCEALDSAFIEKYVGLKGLAGLRKPVDNFFNAVQINVDNSALRQHRYQLLQRLIIGMRQYAAFELIE